MMIEEPSKLGMFTPGRALSTLWEQCNHTASQELIEWFSCHATETASHELRNLAEVVEGLACLVNNDGARNGSESAGNFQTGDSVATLLFSVSVQIEAMACLAEIGSSANYWEQHPEERAKLRQKAV